MCRAAVGALIAFVMLLGSFQVPHRHLHTAFRTRGDSCAQRSMRQPVFSVDSGDASDRDWQSAGRIAVPVRSVVAPPRDGLRTVSERAQTGFTPMPIRRLKLPPSNNELVSL